MDTQSTPRPLGRAGSQAGAMLLLMAGLAGFGYAVAVAGLVTEGDATRTTQDLIASRGLFAAGIGSLFGVVVLDVLVAWALYVFFRPVHRAIAMLGAVLRYVYAAIFALALNQLVGVLGLVNTDAAEVSGDVPGQVMAGLARFTNIWDAGLIVFGLHLIVLGWLGLRSGYVPKFVGVLLAAAGVGYLVDSVGALTTSGQWTDVATFTFIGELAFALWLVIRGRRVRTSHPRTLAATPPRGLERHAMLEREAPERVAAVASGGGVREGE